jgi:VWFA-related protein
MRKCPICLLAALGVTAQVSPPPLRVSVTLVQVDAVVTDHHGHQVRNLTKNDFELLEDGKPRLITHFSYVQTGAAQPGAAEIAPARSRPGIPSSPALRRETVRRTVALVADDLRMSFASVEATRQAFRKFVDQQMAPGDLVAVVSTSGGVGTLQQFTTDKRMLHAAINHIRFTLNGINQASALRAMGPGEAPEIPPGPLGSVALRRFAVGTMGSIRYIIEGMRDMPGRKSLVLFSDGFSLYHKAKKEPDVPLSQAQQLSHRANQAAVVVYGVDPRGLVYPGIKAQDNTRGMEWYEVNQALEDRKLKIRDDQEGLNFLAAETGGLSHLNDNDPNAGLARMLEDQSGYYLLGFQPGEEDSARMDREGKYHRLTVRVKRPGLIVRYRKGYMGETPANPSTPPRTPTERLLAALSSPFAGTGVHLRLTPTFALGDKGQPVVQALLHIGAADLAFAPPDAEGYRLAKVHVVAVTEGEEANAKGRAERTYTIRVKENAMTKIEKSGFVYAFEHEVKKPGPYHMRVAVLDDASGRVGSASRFIEVPEVNKGALALSGIGMRDGNWRPGEHTAAEGQQFDPSSATRVFHRDHPFSYAVTVYNARLDATSRQPAIEIHPRLIRDNRVVWEGKPFQVVLPAGCNPRRIPAGGVLTLGEKTVPGEYLLELQVADPATKRPIPSPWIDFELQ